MNFTEIPLNFSCNTCALYGVLSLPPQPIRRGVLMIVGGPQYRAGSHRQFTLLARQFAQHGIATMRFDYRGMGDSEGETRDFTAIDEDIRAALDCFFQNAGGVERVVLWGLCDAASAALFYAHQDPRVEGLILLNPWVRTEQGAAKAYLKHYYLRRLIDAGFWKKIASGEFRLLAALGSFIGQIGKILFRKSAPAAAASDGARCAVESSLPEQMYQGLNCFQGQVLCILSGDDLTAQEFSDLADASKPWKKLMAQPRITRLHLAEANHTFSQRRWREQVGRWTVEWIKGK